MARLVSSNCCSESARKSTRGLADLLTRRDSENCLWTGRLAGGGPVSEQRDSALALNQEAAGVDVGEGSRVVGIGVARGRSVADVVSDERTVGSISSHFANGSVLSIAGGWRNAGLSSSLDEIARQTQLRASPALSGTDCQWERARRNTALV